MSERLEYEVYGADKPISALTQTQILQYISIFFPGVGDMTITFEKRDGYIAPVISVAFDTENLLIYDRQGNLRKVE